MEFFGKGVDVRVGTKSVLFGVHAFWIHPFVVAYCWWRLYGFPLDPRLWGAFFVHDIGYFGCRDMDGKEGVKHPELGARIMGALFGKKWHDLVLYHSRGYARRDGVRPSALCAPDKMSWFIEPSWMYLPRAFASGEVHLYMKDATGHWDQSTPLKWHKGLQRYGVKIVEDLMRGEDSTWCSSDVSGE